MKSLQVRLHIPADEWKDYSDLMVLRSGAGWYVGTLHTDPEEGFTEPGSRDTTYFATVEIAEKVLAIMEIIWESHGEETALLVFSTWLQDNKLDPHCVGYRINP